MKNYNKQRLLSSIQTAIHSRAPLSNDRRNGLVKVNLKSLERIIRNDMDTLSAFGKPEVTS